MTPCSARLVFMVLLFVAAPARAEVDETIETRTYEVRGSLAADVRARLNAQHKDGFDAQTTWNIAWRFKYSLRGLHCVIDSVRTQLAIVYEMPRLTTPTPVLQASFDAYLVKLRVHEDGHAGNGRAIARRIDAGIASLPPAATCDKLGTAANAFGTAMIAEGAKFDIDYDRRTSHGATQGARWP